MHDSLWHYSHIAAPSWGSHLDVHWRLEAKLFPNLSFITRAEEHSCVLVVDNAAKNCGWLADIIQDWVDGQRESDAMPGGFARFCRSSGPLQRLVHDEIKTSLATASSTLIIEVDAAAAENKRRRVPEPKFSFCSVRGFDSISKPLGTIFDHLVPIIKALAKFDTPWSKRLLDRQFNYQNLASLAVALEILERGRDWVHSRDQRRRGAFQSIAIVKRLNDSFRRDLDALVGGESPLILASGHTTGRARAVIDALRRTMTLVGPSQNVMAAGWPSGWGDKMVPVARGRVLVKWIKQHILQYFPAEGLQNALSPFDLAHWAAFDFCGGSPDVEVAALRECFAPLAECRGADLSKATGSYLATRAFADTVRRRGQKSVVLYWGEAARYHDVQRKHPDLAKLLNPALAQFLGNGELEGDFSRLKAANSGLLSPPQLRAWAKLRLDGPHPQDFENLSSQADTDTTRWISKVQRMYIKLYGNKCLAKAEAKRQSSEIPFVDKRVGVRRLRPTKRQLHEDELEALRKLPTGAPERRCIFGEPPSATDARKFADIEHDLLEGDEGAKAKFDSLAARGRTYGNQLKLDRRQRDPAITKKLESQELHLQERKRRRMMVQVDNPSASYDAGRRAVRPRAGHVLWDVGGRNPLLNGDAVRAELQKCGLATVTTREGKALRTDGGEVADLACTPSIEDFIRGV
jgi:hypothetical protein